MVDDLGLTAQCLRFMARGRGFMVWGEAHHLAQHRVVEYREDADSHNPKVLVGQPEKAMKAAGQERGESQESNRIISPPQGLSKSSVLVLGLGSSVQRGKSSRRESAGIISGTRTVVARGATQLHEARERAVRRPDASPSLLDPGDGRKTG